MNWIWLGVIISLILVELVSINFTAIWFVISAIVSYILLKLNQDYIIQVLVFLLLGGLFIIIVRPKIIKKLFDIRDRTIKKITNKHPLFNYLIPAELKKEYELENKNNKKNKKRNRK